MLIAQWQLVGFIHGVMNTDNMSLAGETIDYGPCAFMDTYDPATVFSSIDAQGRYAYANQPPIAQWNLARLAEAMLPLFDADQAHAVALANTSIARFETRFQHHWLAGMRAKLGLFGEEPDDARVRRRVVDVDARHAGGLHQHVPPALYRLARPTPPQAPMPRSMRGTSNGRPGSHVSRRPQTRSGP